VLYRLFGDKKGLLSAVVDYGFDRYLATKRAVAASDDPVQDLRDGWDTHVAFALAHPAVYRLMYSPGFDAVPSAADEAFRLLRDVLVRCAAAGRLRVDPDVAAQTIMSANIGVALSLVTQPDTYTDPDLSRRVRDAVHAGLLLPPEDRATGATDEHAGEPTDGVVPAALQLTALLRDRSSILGGPETALLVRWLDTLAASARSDAEGATTGG
jgi:AcrR family transcriptional regulator